MRPERDLSQTFGVYVHVPYCRRICPYCDFNVHIAKRANWPQLATAMQVELDHRASTLPTTNIHSVYFGGGTPSLAPLDVLARLLDDMRQRWRGLDRAEITLEADPATLDAPAFFALRELGISRISLGWQSTHEHLLRTLGRGHTAAASMLAFRHARGAGFDSVSLDLIFAVPSQTMAELDADLDTLLRLAPDHVSLYALTYHEGTELHRRLLQGRITAATEDLEAAMMEHIEQRLTSAGYEHYEVSNYALPGKRSRHNQLYWHGGQYLGIGPGAHSFQREGWTRGWRWENTRKPGDYIAAWSGRRLSGKPPPGDASISFIEELNANQLLNERLLLHMRTSDGVDTGDLGANDDMQRINDAIATAHRRGWVTIAGEHITPTSRGLMHADALAALFF